MYTHMYVYCGLTHSLIHIIIAENHQTERGNAEEIQVTQVNGGL